MNKNDVDCCANCVYLLDFPKNNRYGDVDHLCIKTGYFCMGIYKDIHKYKHFSPGGKELICDYKRKSELAG